MSFTFHSVEGEPFTELGRDNEEDGPRVGQLLRLRSLRIFRFLSVAFNWNRKASSFVYPFITRFKFRTGKLTIFVCGQADLLIA